MNEDLIDLIKQRGYWRINIRPIRLPGTERSLTELLDLVSKSMVQLRGWYYPHVPASKNESQGVDRLHNCIQSWSSWSWHLEFWRMFTSEQFLHYVALTEDWRHENCNALSRQPTPPEALYLGVTESAWLIAEVFEFLSRLNQHGLYASGAHVSIQLRNAQGRMLRVDEINRIPFAVAKETQAKNIEFTRALSVDEIGQPKSIAREALYHIYDRFGWRPGESMLKAEIERLYTPHRVYG